MFKSTPRLFARRVEAIPHEQEKQTAPNMDNVDNRTQTRPPCGEEEAAPPPFFCPVCSVRPFVGRVTRPVLFVQQEAKASTQHRRGVQRPNAARYGSAPH